MLFSLSFVSMFVIGGLSGIFMAATPVDIFIHDTYYIVAHFHYVLFCGTAMAVMGAIYFWFPKMFGRSMNEGWGKLHFFLTFIFMNGTFYLMHILGAVGFPRRLADPYHYETFKHLLPMNRFITWCAVGMVLSQVIFAINFFYSIFKGQRVGRNPWRCNTLEWFALVHRLVMETLTPSRLYIVVLTNTVLPKLIPTITHRPNHLRKVEPSDDGHH